MNRQDPETPAQAAGWQRVNTLGLRFGQNGFRDVHPPCDGCAPLVATLPKGRLGGWRTVLGDAKLPKSWGPGRAGDIQASVGAMWLLDADTAPEPVAPEPVAVGGD